MLVECSWGVCRDGFKEDLVHLFTFHNTSNAGFFTTIFYLAVFKATFVNVDRGGTVVKVLCYKSEGHWFDPRWCHWNF